MQHLRRAFRGFGFKPKQDEVAGIRETRKLAKDIIYHAKGRLYQTPAFEHEIIGGRVTPTIDVTRIDHGANSTVVAAILRAEERDKFRAAANLLFNGPRPNFAIDFTVKPKVGDRVILLRRTVQIIVPGMDDDGIARELCDALREGATELRHDSLPRQFKNVNSLFLLTRNSYATAQFWHNVLLYAYVKIVFRDEYPGSRRA